MTKKIIAIILSVAAAMGCTSALAADYSDVNKSAWYYDYVNRISELKAFSGYEDGTFRPDNQITQEEFLKTVVCLISGELTEDNMAETKNPWNTWDAWAVPYLDKAFELGLVTEQDNMFRYVSIPCTRAQMARLITRAVAYMGEEEVQNASSYASKMKDYISIKEDYKPYVLQAYAKGIISGYENGMFKPEGYLTRAEASSVLVRLVDKDARVTEESSSSHGGHSSNSEKTYDFYGKQVTWTEPLRTDVPEQYQVSLSDLDIAEEDFKDGFDVAKIEMSESKTMMFEDLVLQSLTYDGDRLSLSIPDYLPKHQKWQVWIMYNEGNAELENEKFEELEEPGRYEFTSVKELGAVRIRVIPADPFVPYVSTISVLGENDTLNKNKGKIMVSFSSFEDDMPWVQGQGYKDYMKDYTGEIRTEIDW